MGQISTALGVASGAYRVRPDILDIPPDASRVILTFSPENVRVVIAPISAAIMAEAMALEKAGRGVPISKVRAWILPVFGPIFGRPSGGYRLARLDDVVAHIDWIEEPQTPSATELSDFIKEHILGGRWSEGDWVFGRSKPFVDLAEVLRLDKSETEVKS